MKSTWIVILCPAILLIMASSTNALEWSLESLFYPMTYIENKIEGIFSKSISRQKRAVTDPVPEDYFLDIEITIPNSSFLDPLRSFVKNLAIPMPLNITGSIVNITSITVTTVCSVNNNSVSCSCESGYIWPDNVCSKNPQCSAPSSSQNCKCLSTYPSQGCQVEDPGVPRYMTFKILEDYVEDLKNPASQKYQEYKNNLERAFRAGYRSLKGFKSADVIGFRKGSIISDFVIVAAPASDADIAAANSKVLASLNSTYALPAQPFQTVISDRTNFTADPPILFEKDKVTLSCQTISNSTSISWSYNGVTILPDGKKYTSEAKLINGTSVSTLTIKNTLFADGGNYTCSLDDDTNLYVQSKTITVQLIVTGSTVVCNNTEVNVFSCCTSGDIGTLNASCKTNGDLHIFGNSMTESNCVVYSLQASNDQCKTDSSGKVTQNYSCQCSTGNGAMKQALVEVTFIRKANVTINRKHIVVSKNFPFNLTCSSDVNVSESITWKQDTQVDTQYYNNTSTATNAKSTLSARATNKWKGTIICIFIQNTIEVTESATIEVVDLPTQDEISVSPNQINIPCNTGISAVKLRCCCQESGNYTVTFGTAATAGIRQPEGMCYNAIYTRNICSPETVLQYCKFRNQLNDEVQSQNITLNYFQGNVRCNDSSLPLLGEAPDSATATISCQESSTVGYITYICSSGKWEVKENNCVSSQINKRFLALKDLINSPNPQGDIPSYLQNLSATVTASRESISSSVADINKLTDILESISNLAKKVEVTTMTSFIETLDIVVQNISTWQAMKPNARTSDGSRLLKAADNFASNLQIINGTAIIKTDNAILQGISTSPETEIFNPSFTFNNSRRTLTGNVNIPIKPLGYALNTTFVTIGYATFTDILPGDGNKSLNGLVMSTVVSNNQSSPNFKIVMQFQKRNPSLDDASCVFWNYTLNSTGGWDGEGCQAMEAGGNVTCSCNHLTSFSILMSSREEPEDPVLDLITYIGVGISMASLVVCIIIEALVWKSVTKNKTSYMRHVCLVNIAVSLLVADIWFIIGASLQNTTTNTMTNVLEACDAVTFFTHLFYLSLFFWMLTMGLILFYRLVYVFHDMSRTAMLTIAFSLGYGCPLVISVITVAVTRPSNNYRVDHICWLNITPTKAFLAFVVPALIIVAVNFIILVVVIVKLLRPSVGDRPRQKEEKSTLVKIAKSVAILTPLLGLTWGFGIGTMVSNNHGILGTFSALNAFQGLFILVFGTLWDTKIRDALFTQFSLSRWTSQPTQSTSLGSSRLPFSTPGIKMPAFSKLSINIFGKKGKYNLYPASKYSSEATSDSYSVLN